MKSRSGTSIALGLIALLLGGCSGNASLPPSDGPTASDDLADVAGLLRDHTAEFQRGPSKLADTAKNEPLYSRGYKAVRSGDIVVLWGVAMPLEGGGTAIVAYEKKVPSEGGGVLLLSGEVKQMSAAEFQSAPKAK